MRMNVVHMTLDFGAGDERHAEFNANLQTFKPGETGDLAIPVGPQLILDVKDQEEALEIVATIERSRQRRTVGDRSSKTEHVGGGPVQIGTEGKDAGKPAPAAAATKPPADKVEDKPKSAPVAKPEQAKPAVTAAPTAEKEAAPPAEAKPEPKAAPKLASVPKEEPAAAKEPTEAERLAQEQSPGAPAQPVEELLQKFVPNYDALKNATMKDIIAGLNKVGITAEADIIAICEYMKDKLPRLGRINNLPQRVAELLKQRMEADDAEQAG